jgi:hypothetical protein
MVLAAVMAGAGVIVGGCSQCLPLPCPSPPGVTFASSCGMIFFPASCNGNTCELGGNAAETCDGSIKLGDGTVHTVHVVISDPPGGSSCGCPVAPMEVTVDGKGPWREGSVIDFGAGMSSVSSPTCNGMRPDGGSQDGASDASSDAAGDGPTE